LAESSEKLKMDSLLRIWNKKEVRMISTVYNGTTGEVTNKFGERIRHPNTVIQYKFM
jgi:hypothetical protein